MWTKRLLLLLCCLFFLSPCLWAQSLDGSTRGEIVSLCVTLKAQLQACDREIASLQAQISASLTDSQKLKDRLAAQETLYKTLSEQLDKLNKRLKELETENNWLVAGCIGLGTATIALGVVLIFIPKK